MLVKTGKAKMIPLQIHDKYNVHVHAHDHCTVLYITYTYYPTFLMTDLSTRTSPMHILLNVQGHVKVDDVLNIWNVQSPSSHRRCHKYGGVASLEVPQCPFSLGLASVSMDTGTFQALFMGKQCSHQHTNTQSDVQCVSHWKFPIC